MRRLTWSSTYATPAATWGSWSLFERRDEDSLSGEGDVKKKDKSLKSFRMQLARRQRTSRIGEMVLLLAGPGMQTQDWHMDASRQFLGSMVNTSTHTVETTQFIDRPTCYLSVGANTVAKRHGHHAEPPPEACGSELPRRQGERLPTIFTRDSASRKELRRETEIRDVGVKPRQGWPVSGQIAEMCET